MPAELPNDSAITNTLGWAPVPVTCRLPPCSDALVTVRARPFAGKTNSAAKAATMMKLRTEFPPEHPRFAGNVLTNGLFQLPGRAFNRPFVVLLPALGGSNPPAAARFGPDLA